jgi:phosphatidylserine/phosphatidylglycerophosphate/cardiolipin synthase-like enzyme
LYESPFQEISSINEFNVGQVPQEELEDAALARARRWFTGGSLNPVNNVTALVDGADTYESMVKAIRTATSSSHFIYFANWRMDLKFPLIPKDPNPRNTTLESLLLNADMKKVEIRALLSFDFLGNHPGSRNITKDHYELFGYPLSKNLILNRVYPGKLKYGSWIMDDNHLNFGLHHQKILVVKGNEGLIGFCGGVDFAPNRLGGALTSGGGSGSGSAAALGSQHDVHCKIQGPAARILLDTFIDRWEDHPDKPKNNFSLLGKKELATPPVKMGSMIVRIGTTFGNGMKHKGIKSAKGDPFYSFANSGRQDVWRMVFHAIKQAKKYIYIEDQYLMSLDAATELRKQILGFEKLRIIILIPHSKITTDLQFPFQYRSKFILTLTGGKYPHPQVSICYRKVDKPHNYVHAKTWIFDDEFAMIGSANCNNRGYTHDSEVVAGICDPAGSFAKDLRIKLWEEHLTIPRASLTDPSVSSRYWFTPNVPISAGIEVVPKSDVIPPTAWSLAQWTLEWQAALRAYPLVDPRGN